MTYKNQNDHDKYQLSLDTNPISNHPLKLFFFNNKKVCYNTEGGNKEESKARKKKKKENV